MSLKRRMQRNAARSDARALSEVPAGGSPNGEPAKKPELNIAVMCTVGDTRFEGSRFVNGQHKRSFSAKTLKEFLLAGLGPYLEKDSTEDWPDGARIQFAMSITKDNETEDLDAFLNEGLNGEDKEEPAKLENAVEGDT